MVLLPGRLGDGTGLVWIGAGLFPDWRYFSVIAGPLFYFWAGAFLLAQVSYIIGFSPAIPGWHPAVHGAGFAGPFGGQPALQFRPPAIESNPVHARMKNPVLIYSIALSLMFFSAALTLAEPEWAAPAAVLAAVGGMLFFSSDSLLSYNRFVRPVPNGQLLVRILYHLGQIALTAGVLIHFSR